MAVETSTASDPLIKTIITDTDSDTTVETAAGGDADLYFVEITNPNTVAVYTKLFAAASGSSPTDQHFLQFYCPASTNCYAYIPTFLLIGAGIQFYTTTDPGAVGSQCNPTEKVIVKIGLTVN